MMNFRDLKHIQQLKNYRRWKKNSYGARALIEGGFQSLPKMFMPELCWSVVMLEL